MKVILENTVFLNGGDAAIALAIMNMLKEAFGNDVEFVVFGSQTEIAKKYYPEINFREEITDMYRRSFFIKALRLFGIKGNRVILSFWKQRVDMLIQNMERNQRKFPYPFREDHMDLILEYKNADIIISTGGTYLVENYDLTSRIIELYKDTKLRAPLIFFTQSLGPFTKGVYKSSFKQIFDRASLILLRETRSLDHLRDIGVTNAAARVVADAAFSFAEGAHGELTVPTRKTDKFDNAKVAISVRDWEYYRSERNSVGNNRYHSAIRSVVTMLVETHNAHVEFISTCQGINEYAKDDSRVATQICETLPAHVVNNVNINYDFHRPEDLVRRLKFYDMVISTRLHMAILALCAGVPVLPIAYEFKTTEVFKSINQDEWVISIDDLTSENLRERCHNFISSISSIAVKQRAGTMRQCREAKLAISILKNVLNKQINVT